MGSPGTGARSQGMRQVPETRDRGPEGQDAKSPGPGVSSQMRGAQGRRRRAKSPMRRARKRAMRTEMRIVVGMNKMMIVLFLALHLKSVGSIFKQMVFRWTF